MYIRKYLTAQTSARTAPPPLQPMPVGGPFHTIGVDILKLPLTYDRIQYAVIFIDYLTKWVEAFPIHAHIYYNSGQNTCRLLSTYMIVDIEAEIYFRTNLFSHQLIPETLAANKVLNTVKMGL